MKINEIITEGAISPQTWNSLTPQQKQEIAGYINDLTGQGQAAKVKYPNTSASDYAGDIAGAIAGQSGATSLFKQATQKQVPVPAPAGSELKTTSGIYKKTNQGWIDPNNRLTTPAISQTLEKQWFQVYQQNLDAKRSTRAPQQPAPVSQVDTSKIQASPKPGAPTSAEQAKLQQKIQAAMQAQQP